MVWMVTMRCIEIARQYVKSEDFSSYPFILGDDGNYLPGSLDRRNKCSVVAVEACREERNLG